MKKKNKAVKKEAARKGKSFLEKLVKFVKKYKWYIGLAIVIIIALVLLAI